MATILNNAPYMGFPLSIKRGNPAPVDTTAVWYNKTELETYAASGATAYVGQILTLVADSKCEAYMISNEAGTLIKLASTTASGDLASDVATLQGQVADLIAAVGKKAAGEEPATGIYKEIADVITLANSKVASVKAADKSITIAGTATAPTVKVALSAAEGNALELAADGLKVTIPTVDVPEYTIKQKTLSAEEAKTSPYAAIYQLMKGDTQAGVDINIPKDMVVQSGTVETFYEGALPEGVDKPGTYIVLILANTGSKPLYIPVSSLVDVYTGTPTEDAKTATVLINVDPTTHVITASIRASSVTKAMLDSTVQASLKKADDAVQTITTGSDTSTNGTITVDGKEVAVKGLADAAYATVASLNTTAEGYANTAKTAIIGNAETDTADSKTIEGVKKYAHGQAVAAQEGATKAAEKLVNDLDVTDTAVDGKVVSAVSQTNGKITVTRRALVEADIPELAQSKISGLETALEGKQATVEFDGTYNASSNKAATVSTVTSAISGVKGVYADASKDDETIAGAKKYADDKASTALTDAKTYADGLVTGDSGITKRVEALEGKVDVDKVSTAISTADDAVKTALIGTATDIADKDTIKGAKAYADGKFDTLDGTISGLATKVNNNAAAITTLNGDANTTGSVAKAVADAKTELNTEISKKQDKITKETTLAVQTLTTESSGITINPHVEGNDSISIENDGSNTLHLKKGTYGKAVEITNVATPSGNTSAANKKYVDDTITNATKGLTGAMHYIGASSTDPMLPAGPTVTGHTGAFASGDVVTWGDNKEYVYDGTTWRVLGDEGSYIVKGTKFTDADIADNAAISQLKIDGLQTALAAKLNSTEAESLYVPKKTGFSLVDDAEITKLGTVEVHAQANKIESIKAGGTALTIDIDKSVNIPAASASVFGVIKVDDTSIKSTGGTIAIKAVSTDLLTQGAETLILNCGGAAD